MFNVTNFPRRTLSGLIVLTLGLAFSGPGQAAPPQLAVTTCAACHGADGNSTDAQYPKLAGQKAPYLQLQLRALRSGERPSSVMNAFAQGLTDAQIDELARLQRPAYSTADRADRGGCQTRRCNLWLGWRGVTTACAVCHAPDGGGRGMMGGGMMRTNPARSVPLLPPRP